MESYENNIPNEENLTPQESLQELPQQEEPAAVQEEAAGIAEEPAIAQEAAPIQEEPPVEEETPARRAKASPYEDSPYVMNHVPAAPKKKKKRTGVGKKILCAVLVLALVVGSCTATGILVSEYWEDRLDRVEDAFYARMKALEDRLNQSNAGISISGSPQSSAGGLTPAQVYAKNVGAVVMVYNKVTLSQYGQSTVSTSTGSGFILTEDGYVVTNYHVVEGGGKLSIVTHDNTTYAAKLVGYDSTNDVALLKVEATGLQAVTLGSSGNMIVGDQVVAIGNPLGELTSTLTVGYISAKERDVNTDGFAINMMQTDAAINSGNSGGPLFNMRGEVVGITTAKYSGTSSGGASIEGVGFAIPIDDVKGIFSDLSTYGYITGAYLGVKVSDMDPAAADYYGMPIGAYVQEATEGYAAQKAGIKEKDIIVYLGSIRVENVNDLTRALRSFKAGDETTVTVYRGGRELVLDIVLDEKPQDVG